MVLGDIRRLQLGQDSNLLDDIIHIILGILDINNLDSDRLASASIYTGIFQFESANCWATALIVNLPFEYLSETSTACGRIDQSAYLITTQDHLQESGNLPMHVCLV